MKSILTPLFLCVSMFTAIAQTVTQSADLPAPGRFGAVAFVIDSFAYAGLGETGSEQYPKQFFRYDPADDTWTEIAPFPGQGREYAVSFTHAGQGYVGLGFTLSGVELIYHRDFYRYDPPSDTWVQIADYGGIGRVKGVAFVLDSIAYAGIGSNAGVLLNDFWKYDADGDTWTEVSSLSNIDPMQDASVAVLDHKAYLIGGRKAGGIFMDQILAFDPAVDGVWHVQKTVPGMQFEGGSAFPLDQHIYFGYGAADSRLHIYDPETNAVSDFGPLPGLESIDRGPVSFALDSVTAFFGLGYTSVVANQPSGYRNEMWKLEIELPSEVRSLEPEAFPQVVRTASGMYELDGFATDAVFHVRVLSTSGILLKSIDQVRLSEPFTIQAPAGLYCFAIMHASGAVASTCVFHTASF